MFIAFSSSLVSIKKKTLLLFPVALQFFYRLLYIAFLFLIAFSLSLRKVYRFSIIASDDIKHRR